MFGVFFVIDLVFFAANALKVPEGGWVPLVLGLALMALMTSWKRGRDLLLARWKQDSLPLASFLARLPQSRTVRVPGMAVFMTGNPDYVPGALLHNLKHNKVLHERVLFVTVEQRRRAGSSGGRAQRGDRAGAGHPPGDHPLRLHGKPEPAARPGGAARDRGRVRPDAGELLPGPRNAGARRCAPKLPLWRLWLFLVMARNAVPATEFFRIPSDRVVELGVRVAI